MSQPRRLARAAAVLAVVLAAGLAAALVSQPAKLPGFGYTPPPGSCACLWRDSAAGGAGGGLDCWLIDQTAIPFFDQHPFPTPASYAAAVRRWHLHAAAPDYYPPDLLAQLPEGDRILVKGYIPGGCDGESIGYPRCAAGLTAWCQATHGDRYDCQQHPELGRVVIELYDWVLVNQQRGRCPSGVGAGFLPPPQPTPAPTASPTPPPASTPTPAPPADPCRPRGLCLDMFGTCSPCPGATPTPTPRPTATPQPTAPPVPTASPAPAPTPVICPPPHPCETCPAYKRVEIPASLRECLGRLANLRPMEPLGLVTWREQRRECVAGLLALVNALGEAAYVPGERTSGNLSQVLDEVECAP